MTLAKKDEIDCPVCGRRNLIGSLAQCPQCNADLQCFQMLEALQEPEAPTTPAQKFTSLSLAQTDAGVSLLDLQNGLQSLQRLTKRWAMVLVLLIVFAMGVFFQSPSLVQVELDRAAVKNQDLSEAVAQAVSGIINANQQLTAIEQRVANVVAMVEQQQAIPDAPLNPLPQMGSTAKFLIHSLQNDDTLWQVSRTYFQQGKFYPVLLETNPGLGVYFKENYGKIQILKDQQAVEALFARLVFVEENEIFFRYQVQAKDTWAHISKLFYGHKDHSATLQTRNAAMQLQAGNRVIVPLYN